MVPPLPHWIHVELLPVWTHVKNLRHFVREFCMGMGHPHKAADQVAMTTSELLENATKYASTSWVRFDLVLNGTQAEVTVKNRTTAEQKRLLLAFVEQVNQGEALSVYVQCLERQNATGLSQSGLARIRYEAGAELRVREDGDEVSVTACIPV